MRRHRLGKTNLMVSCTGPGGIPLARISKKEAVRLIHLAIEKGINFIDTARNYEDSEGRSERPSKTLGIRLSWPPRAWTGPFPGPWSKLRPACVPIALTSSKLHQAFTPSDLEKVIAPHRALAAAKQARKEGKILYYRD